MHEDAADTTDASVTADSREEATVDANVATTAIDRRECHHHC